MLGAVRLGEKENLPVNVSLCSFFTLSKETNLNMD